MSNGERISCKLFFTITKHCIFGLLEGYSKKINHKKGQGNICGSLALYGYWWTWGGSSLASVVFACKAVAALFTPRPAASVVF